MEISRRSLLTTATTLATSIAAMPCIARAFSIPPDVRAGTIQDVEHVVVLMQENRSFDHYFGTLRGVRGFRDRFPIPLQPSGRQEPPGNVWQQLDRSHVGGSRTISPFHLETRQNFELMRMAGTPHSWPDAQHAWDEGRMGHWPEAKEQRAMGHYRRDDIPFQFALADAFTICDAYHCSIQAGTNTNRVFLWSATNDPAGDYGGPVLGNSHDQFPENGGFKDPYRWTTVVERLQAKGVDWRIYQDMADNFTDNPLVGFENFRRANQGISYPELKDRALSTHTLAELRADVLAGRLPQVSYVIADAAGCEHPGPSSPAQGAAYTATVLDALTADPAVWARTVLFVMFDENDGFFDHMPPPAPPSHDANGAALGGSTVDLEREYHLTPSIADSGSDPPELRGRPFGLGARVPMYVVSPWSRGGWVNSQVFDHTSITRFLEVRFGIHEPNISPWRRAICGDLTSAFDFTTKNPSIHELPDPRPDARRAAALKRWVIPKTPDLIEPPWQEPGIRLARPLPYQLEVTDVGDIDGVRLRFVAEGSGAVFHVYNRLALEEPPRRYTVESGQRIDGRWSFGPNGDYDLWILGPNGFHRRFAGTAHDLADLRLITWGIIRDQLSIQLPPQREALALTAVYLKTSPPWERHIALKDAEHTWSLAAARGWYDVTIQSGVSSQFVRRVSGRHDRASRMTTSDPFDVRQVSTLEGG